MSDAKKAQLAQAQAAANQIAASQRAGGPPVQVSGTGPLGLPPSVSILGLNVPTLAVVAVVGAVVLALAAMAVHAFAKK